MTQWEKTKTIKSEVMQICKTCKNNIVDYFTRRIEQKSSGEWNSVPVYFFESYYLRKKELWIYLNGSIR